MSEQEWMNDRAGPHGSGEDLLEAQLRALCAAAYLPLPASEELRQRVAEQTARGDARAARQGTWRPLLPIRLWPAVGAAALAVILAVLGLALARWDHGRGQGSPSLPLALRPHSGRTGPGVQPPPLRTSHRRELATQSYRQRPGRGRRTVPPSTGSGGGSMREGGTVDRPPAPGSQPQNAFVDDLAYLNVDPAVVGRRWAAMSRDEWERIEERVRRDVRVGDDFVHIPFPRLASASASSRQVAAAVAAYKREAAIVDPRLSREVMLAFKATALSDVCDRLRADTDIRLEAGASVADEKVTLFCEKMPLREVMRQLARPFGYTWLRSRVPPRSVGGEGEYRYELVQDLRSQLLEEELRNRDRNAALLALDREMGRYRKYLDLSPDEALARARAAAPAERKLLEKLAHLGWGPIQMYYRLSREELAALRAGQELKFSAAPDSGELPLPPDIARGVLQSLREVRLRKYENVHILNRSDVYGGADPSDPSGLPLIAIPEARALVTLRIYPSELGHLALAGESGYFASRSPGRRPPDSSMLTSKGPLAVGTSTTIRHRGNSVANGRFARDPALQARVTANPPASYNPSPLSSYPSPGREGAWREAATDPKVTTADVLGAIHKASGLPVIGDYYTRLYLPRDISVERLPLFEALNRLSDTMRLRWNKEGKWLQFRSTTFFDDRLKEVPNRLLARWSVCRRQHGALTLDDLIEIAQLSDAQLDGAEQAEGARLCFGLLEWELARNGYLRPHLRYLADLTPAQRQEAMSPAGLAFTRMSLAQQQGFVARALGSDAEGLQSLDLLAGATLRADYSLPGEFEWRVPVGGWLQWVRPVAPDKRAPRPPVRERSREAALQAARRTAPQFRQAVLQSIRRVLPQFDETQLFPQEGQIVPTRLDLTILYIPGASHTYPVKWTNATEGNVSQATW